MRFRDENPGDLARARAAVTGWREEHPEGTAEELLDALRGQFHNDWAPVLRAVLYVVDKHAARITCGIVTGAAGASR